MQTETRSLDQGTRLARGGYQGYDEAEEEEDLGEVKGKLFSIITKFQDTTHGSVQTRHARHVDTSLSFTTE